MWLPVLIIVICICGAIYSSKLRREKRIHEEQSLYDKQNQKPAEPRQYPSQQTEKEDCSRKYFDAIQNMGSIRITGMTRAIFNKYISYGEEALLLLPRAIDEWRERDERISREFELPPFIPCRDNLPDMYMRWGQWDDAKRVFAKCHEAGVLDDVDYDRLMVEADAKRSLVEYVIQILNDNPAPMKQIELKKSLKAFAPPIINWVLRFYKGIERTKNESNYMITKVEF